MDVKTSYILKMKLISQSSIIIEQLCLLESYPEPWEGLKIEQSSFGLARIILNPWIWY